MSVEPPSGRKEFDGIASFYDEEIAPYLRAREDARQDAIMYAGLILIGTAVAAAMIMVALPFPEDIKMRMALIAGFGGVAFAAWRVNKTRGEIANGLLQRTCNHLGFQYRFELSRPFYCNDFDRLKLLPNFNREKWEDEVRGSRENADFVLCEAHLRYRSSGKNKSTRTVFHGQLLVIDYKKKFLGETIVKRDAGIFNGLMKPGKGFQRVGITSPKFEKIFEAWSTDQVEARDLLDPIVLERFEELDRLFSGAKLRAAFSQGKLFVAMETGDKLNMGSMFRTLESPERFANILKEFDLIFDLIDVLLKRASGRLDGAFSVEAVR